VPAPIAAVTAAGRPRAGERTARGEKGVASALIVESGRARSSEGVRARVLTTDDFYTNYSSA
jgi:hypothetical protein